MVNFLGRSLPGRLSNVLNVFHLRMIFTSVEWCTPSSLEMALKPYLDWWAATFASLRSLLMSILLSIVLTRQKTSAFIHVHTFPDDQWLECLNIITLLLITLLIPMKELTLFFFNTGLLHYSLVFVRWIMRWYNVSWVVVHLKFYSPNWKTWLEPGDFFMFMTWYVKP